VTLFGTFLPPTPMWRNFTFLTTVLRLIENEEWISNKVPLINHNLALKLDFLLPKTIINRVLRSKTVCVTYCRPPLKMSCIIIWGLCDPIVHVSSKWGLQIHLSFSYWVTSLMSHIHCLFFKNQLQMTGVYAIFAIFSSVLTPGLAIKRVFMKQISLFFLRVNLIKRFFLLFLI